MSGRLAVAFPWLFLLAAGAIVAWDHAAPRTTLVAAGETPAAPDPGAPATARDPVCGMTVRASTAHRLVHGGRLHHFCSTACRDEAAAAPARWLAGRAQPVDAGHTMRGIPSWMFQLGVGLVLVVSFGLFELAERLRGARPDAALAHRVDLAPAGSLRHRLYRSRGVRLALQIAMTSVFVLIVAAGLFGSQNPAFNIAPILTWTLWWAGLVFFVLYAGKLWCWVCPWDAAATWLERLPLGAGGARLGLRLPWPRRLRNIWLAVGLFLLLTWIELGQGVTSIPRMTAVLALAMLAMTVAGALVFDRKSFCRYGCLVGRVSGLYALFSSLELRTRTPSACAECAGKDCYRGNADGEGCPTFQYPPAMSRSTTLSRGPTRPCSPSSCSR